MKLEEAKKYLKNFVGDGSMEFVIGPMITEVLKIAIDALEKQVPKKPEFQYVTTNGYGSYEYVCDECGCVLGENIDDFCPNCGQAIDWGYTE